MAYIAKVRTCQWAVAYYLRTTGVELVGIAAREVAGKLKTCCQRNQMKRDTQEGETGQQYPVVQRGQEESELRKCQ